MSEKGKPPDFTPVVFDGVVSLDAGWIFARTPFDDAVDRAFDAMLIEQMRLLDEKIMNGPADPPLGIFNR